MFNSGIKVKDLVAELKNTEVDIALDIPNLTYVTWLNALQQLLYREVIKEQRKWVFTNPFQNPISILSIKPQTGENQPIFEDIHAVYAGECQLIKSTLSSGVIFPNTYFKDNNDIGYSIQAEHDNLTIVYYVRPAIIEVSDVYDEATNDYPIDESFVMFPIEFIDLVKSKLRGEAYKLVNEDGIAAKWLNDYNILLETFKTWIIEKYSTFGL